MMGMAGKQTTGSSLGMLNVRCLWGMKVKTSPASEIFRFIDLEGNLVCLCRLGWNAHKHWLKEWMWLWVSKWIARKEKRKGWGWNSGEHQDLRSQEERNKVEEMKSWKIMKEESVSRREWATSSNATEVTCDRAALYRWHLAFDGDWGQVPSCNVLRSRWKVMKGKQSRQIILLKSSTGGRRERTVARESYRVEDFLVIFKSFTAAGTILGIL